MSVTALRALFAATLSVLLFAAPGNAQITRFVVERTEPIGQGGYERLTGHAYGELDPHHSLNAIITDLEAFFARLPDILEIRAAHVTH